MQIGKQSALGGAAASPKLSICRCQAGAAAPVWSSYASKTVFTPAWSDLLAAGRQKPATFLQLAGATQGQKLTAPMSDRPSPAPCNVREARLEQVSTSACRHLCNALRHDAQLQSLILGQTAGRRVLSRRVLHSGQLGWHIYNVLHEFTVQSTPTAFQRSSDPERYPKNAVSKTSAADAAGRGAATVMGFKG